MKKQFGSMGAILLMAIGGMTQSSHAAVQSTIEKQVIQSEDDDCEPCEDCDPAE